MNPKLFGSRIRQAREQIGITQEELAIRMSRDQRSISEYENGHRRLSATDVPLLAKALDVPITFFYEGEIGLHDYDRDLLKEFHQLSSPEAMKAAIEMLRLLVATLKLHAS